MKNEAPTATLLEDWQISGLLANLVDKSLVVFEADPNGGGRYHLLETMRQYGSAKLQEDGEKDVLGGRHRDFFLQWAEDAHGKLGGLEQSHWFARMEEERDNLRVAMEWSLRDENGAQAALRLSQAMQHSLFVHGRSTESQAWLTAALEHPAASEPTLARARALAEAGYVAQRRHDFDLARVYLEEGVMIFRALGDREGIAHALVNLGVLARNAGDRDGARRMQTEAQALSRAVKVGWLEAIALTNLAELEWEEGHEDAARALLEQIVATWRRLGDALNEAYALMKLGNLNGLARPAETRVCFVRALRPLHDSGDFWSLAGALESVARLDVAAGQPARAVSRLLAAQALRNSLDLPDDFPLHELEAVRETLGADAFAAAAAAARAQTLPQLIEDICHDV